MNRINNFLKIYTIIIASLFGLLTPNFLTKLINNDSNFLIGSSSLIISIILVFIFRMLAEKILSSSKILRIMIIGKQFIEGYWISLIITDDEVIGSALYHISFEDNRLIISGTSFEKIKTFSATFHAEHVWYNNYKLSFTFNKHISDSNKPVSNGFEEIIFQKGNKITNYSSGYSIDSSNGIKKIIHLQKIKKRQTIWDLGDPQFRNNFLRLIALKGEIPYEKIGW